MLFSMCLSIELWIVIRSMLHPTSRRDVQTSEDKGRRRRLDIYIAVSLFMSVFFTVADGIATGYGRKEGESSQEISWCWVEKMDTVDFISFYGVAATVLVVVVVCYSLVLWCVFFFTIYSLGLFFFFFFFFFFFCKPLLSHLCSRFFFFFIFVFSFLCSPSLQGHCG
jgi:hypothetical protein